MRLVPLFEATQNTDRRCLVRFIDHHFLESPLQRLIGLKIFLILIQRRRTDSPQVTTRQRRFQDVRCVHGAATLTRTYQRVDLIDKQYDLARGGDYFVHDAFQTLFELALVFRAGDKGSHIEGVDLFLLQVLRNIPAHDTMRQTFCDSGLTHTRFTNQNRVILRSPAQDL